jgi:hypothetical protein
MVVLITLVFVFFKILSENQLTCFMDNFIIIVFIWSHILRNVHQWPFLIILNSYEWFLLRKYECKKLMTL